MAETPVSGLIPRSGTMSLSCIVPVYDEAENLQRFLPELCAALEALTPDYEVIVVNDGSRDSTLPTALQFVDRLPITVVDLSRNFGKEHALTAGLDYANADATILIDADFQHPLSLLPELVRLWRAGYDMVYGVRSRRTEGHRKRWFTALFYYLMRRWSEIEMPEDAGDFRILDRRVVEVLRRLPERSRYMKGLYAWVGFRSTGITFEEAERRHGRSAFNFWRLSSLAMTGLTAFTALPLRALVVAGLVTSLSAFAYAGYLVFDYLLHGNAVPGWPTLASSVIFFGGLQLLAIGIVGEYVGRIFTEVKQRPNFIVAAVHRDPRTQRLPASTSADASN